MSEQNNNFDELNERMISMETRLAFAEDTINQLNTAAAERDKEISALRSYCRELKLKIDELAEAGGSSPMQADQKPPHY